MPQTLYLKCDVVKSNKACLWHHEARNKNVVNDESVSQEKWLLGVR